MNKCQSLHRLADNYNNTTILNHMFDVVMFCWNWRS